MRELMRRAFSVFFGRNAALFLKNSQKVREILVSAKIGDFCDGEFAAEKKRFRVPEANVAEVCGKGKAGTF